VRITEVLFNGQWKVLKVAKEDVVHDEVKKRINLGKAYYYSVQKLLFSVILSTLLKSKTKQVF